MRKEKKGRKKAHHNGKTAVKPEIKNRFYITYTKGKEADHCCYRGIKTGPYDFECPLVKIKIMNQVRKGHNKTNKECETSKRTHCPFSKDNKEKGRKITERNNIKGGEGNFNRFKNKIKKEKSDNDKNRNGENLAFDSL